MNEERRMILEMLKDGSLSVEEAEKLLEAVPIVEEENAHLMPRTGLAPKRISVLVTDHGRTKVNVKIPFSLVRAGLKIGKTFGAIGMKHAKDESEAQVMAVLQEIDLDEILLSLDDGEIALPYTIVDVEDQEKGETCHVVIE